MMRFDESKLVATRNPDEIDYAESYSSSMSRWNEQGLKTWDSWNGDPATYFDEDEADRRKYEARAYEVGKADRAYDRGYEPRSVYDVVRDYPRHVADYLEHCGYDAEQLMQEMGWPSIH